MSEQGESVAAVRMQIESTPSHLPAIRGAVQQMCGVIGFEEDAACQAAVAVDEALANIIEHAYDGRSSEPIEVTLSPVSDGDRGPGLEVVLKDHGRVVAPEGIQGRDLNDIRPGGLGTHIMSECMDVVHYEHPPEGGTALRMVKYLRDSNDDDVPGDKGGTCDC